jgi:hypothetical protein
MSRRYPIIFSTILFALTAPLDAGVRKFEAVAWELVHPPAATGPLRAAGDTATIAAAPWARPFATYPVAGIDGEDLFRPYYVDLDPLPAEVRDWSCGGATFNGHTGHDVYLRSFAEMDIGVPLFAPLDGTVLSVHDGEPDRNVEADPDAVSNLVVLDHGNGQRTIFTHLARGISVKEGDRVYAGAEIARIGSSGYSTAPHVHFEARAGGVAYEPFAGPCRPGPSYVPDQPATADRRPRLLGVALSDRPFMHGAPSPTDHTPRRGTFLAGNRQIHIRIDAANIPSNSSYRMRLTSPGGGTTLAGEGTLMRSAARLVTFRWELDAALHATGEWTLDFEIDGEPMMSAPLLVVHSPGEVVNRPPSAVEAVLEPIGAGAPARCTVAGAALISDPDYDVVRYHYRWSRDGETLRETVSAARSDTLAGNLVTADSPLRCEVTVSDGELTSPVASAERRAEQPARRRAVREP